MIVSRTVSIPLVALCLSGAVYAADVTMEDPPVMKAADLLPSAMLVGPDYRLDPRVWDCYDWWVSHCVLRGENAPIQLS